MAEEPKLVLLRDHYVPPTYTPTSSFQLPDITAAHFEIKSGFIQMLPLFYGLNTEDPYKHLDEFIEICSTIRLQNFIEDALRMCLFPFSLKEKAKYWLNSLETNSITSWAQMQHEFLKKYFTIGKTNQIRRDITSFSQIEGEPFHETWERMKDLLRKCPHHAVPKWQLVQCFYDGLTEPHRQMVDASCGGTFMLKSEDDAWTLFENLSENSLHHSSSGRRTNTRSQTLYEVSQPLDLNAKVDALSRKLDQLLASGFVPATASHIHTPHNACSFCSDPSHQAGNCSIIGQSSEPPFEHMNAVYSRPVSDHFNNSYNPALRNNSNMWRPNVPQYNGLQNQAYQQSNNQFYQPPPNSRPPNPQ
jgi:hypothetical protein